MDTFQVLGSVAAFVISFVLFAFVVVALARFLLFVWASVPRLTLTIDGPGLDQLLGVLVGFLLVPSVAAYGWYAAQSLFSFVAREIARVDPSFFGNAACDNLGACLREGVGQSIVLFADLASGLVGAFDLAAFPLWQFVLFLLLALVTTRVARQIREGAADGRLQQWLGQLDRWYPQAARERTVFAVLVLGAFYLALVSLLAIPLFQNSSRPQDLTVDALDKALEPYVTLPPDFDKVYPVDLPTIGTIEDPKVAESIDASMREEFVVRFRSLKELPTDAGSDLQSLWGTMRQSALNDQTILREQAKSLYQSGLEVGIGRKGTAQHFYQLVHWHQTVMQQIKIRLLNCQQRTAAFVDSATQALTTVKTEFESVTRAEDWPTIYRRANDRLRGVNVVFTTARVECSNTYTDRNDIPARSSLIEDLGQVGKLSGWLLVTQQMPVVIIVGLVGFSLLGATVSRAVRVSESDANGSFARLSVDDLVVVIAVGATAAVVVFLAAYGGLAVLGSNAGDPNPYVLFVTCLIGAVYSEDVWAWARSRGIGQKKPPPDQGAAVDEPPPDQAPPAPAGQ